MCGRWCSVARAIVYDQVVVRVGYLLATSGHGGEFVLTLFTIGRLMEIDVETMAD